MSPIPSMPRTLITAALLGSVLAASGCSWFRKGNDLYAQSPESRPLEVPPDLDQPRTDAAIPAPVTASGRTAPAMAAPVTADPGAASAAGASAAASTAASTPGAGFTAAGTRDEVFTRVGQALESVDGVTIANRAQLLGAYDVSYQDSNFLVRVSETEAGTYVSAVDPRGMAATGEAPTRLIAALQAAINGAPAISGN